MPNLDEIWSRPTQNKMLMSMKRSESQPEIEIQYGGSSFSGCSQMFCKYTPTFCEQQRNGSFVVQQVKCTYNYAR